ncbi:galectin-1-like [Pyxicephalus adspersus]|uniref:galectin-1-like n=1 Tax=Pyxicephalus adspersus TaxID=30357 RepID=UPI003B5AE4AE
MDVPGVIVNNLNLKPGQSIEVKGFIPENCKHFSINLGKDSENLLLHFNPRFNHHADIRKIICNSAENNVWGKEQRENVFPFKEGSVTTVSFKYEKEKFIIVLPSGSSFSFPVRFSMETISYLFLINLQLECLKIE